VETEGGAESALLSIGTGTWFEEISVHPISGGVDVFTVTPLVELFAPCLKASKGVAASTFGRKSDLLCSASLVRTRGSWEGR